MVFQPQIWIFALQAALTPRERFEAVRQLDPAGGGSLLTNKWFVLLGWSVIILLLLLLLAFRQMRNEKENAFKEKHFNDQANDLDLTLQERDMVKRIADLAGVKHWSMVLSMRDAFNNGLAQLKHKILAQQSDPEEWTRLKTAVQGIKEKLGFSEATNQALNNRSAREQSSHQIPVGTEVVLTLKKDKLQCIFGAIVTESNEFEMLLQCSQNVNCQSGDVWIVKFQKGAITWEFEAITVELSEQGLKLSHSHNIRFVNRQRFTPVTIQKPAQIALFPTFRKSATDSYQIDIEFNSAELIEIAGSSLILKTSVDLSVRQRVIVLLDLENGLIVQDVGEVRNVVDGDAGRSFSIEMIGLSHKDINELTRITNQMAEHRPLNTSVISSTLRHSDMEVTSNV